MKGGSTTVEKLWLISSYWEHVWLQSFKEETLDLESSCWALLGGTIFHKTSQENMLYICSSLCFSLYKMTATQSENELTRFWKLALSSFILVHIISGGNATRWPFFSVAARLLHNTNVWMQLTLLSRQLLRDKLERKSGSDKVIVHIVATRHDIELVFTLCHELRAFGG